jgi:hypothetical protein
MSLMRYLRNRPARINKRRMKVTDTMPLIPIPLAILQGQIMIPTSVMANGNEITSQSQRLHALLDATVMSIKNNDTKKHFGKSVTAFAGVVLDD